VQSESNTVSSLSETTFYSPPCIAGVFGRRLGWPAKQSILATGIGNPKLGDLPWARQKSVHPTLPLPPLDCIAQRLWGNWKLDWQPRIQLGSWLPDCSVQVSILLRPPPLLLSQLDKRAGLFRFQCSAAAAATAAESLISSKEWLASASAHHPSALDRSEVELRIGRRFFRIGLLRLQSGHPGHISPESQPFSILLWEK